MAPDPFDAVRAAFERLLRDHGPDVLAEVCRKHLEIAEACRQQQAETGELPEPDEAASDARLELFVRGVLEAVTDPPAGRWEVHDGSVFGVDDGGLFGFDDRGPTSVEG